MTSDQDESKFYFKDVNSSIFQNRLSAFIFTHGLSRFCSIEFDSGKKTHVTGWCVVSFVCVLCIDLCVCASYDVCYV